MIASQLSAHYDVISNRLWRHQQNENRACDTRGRCVKIVDFIVIYGFIIWVRNKMRRNSGNKHQLTLSWALKQFVTRVYTLFSIFGMLAFIDRQPLLENGGFHQWMLQIDILVHNSMFKSCAAQYDTNSLTALGVWNYREIHTLWHSNKQHIKKITYLCFKCHLCFNLPTDRQLAPLGDFYLLFIFDYLLSLLLSQWYCHLVFHEQLRTLTICRLLS